MRLTAPIAGRYLVETADGKMRTVYLEAGDIIDTTKTLTGRCPKCGGTFTPGRTNQQYCSPECAKRAAKLAYYHRTGAAKRRETRK